MMGFVGSEWMKDIISLNISILIIFLIGLNHAIDVLAGNPEKPVVVISIDAETVGHDYLKITLPEQFNLKIDGEFCGITRIMDICDKHNVKSTFFLNVYEYKRYGEQVIQDISKSIDGRGFDVQLHTHPQWTYDKKRNMMYQYSLNEQIQIIKDGKNLIKKWIGKDSVIHRAGAYSANEDTLKALYENNIFYDSSFFYLYPTCSLQNLDLKKNVISMSNGVNQIPVNVFYLERYGKWLNFLEPLKGVVKYDIDSIDSETMIKAIDKGIEHHFDVIVLFLHSFTFIREYSEENKVADIVDIREFNDVLEYITKRELEIVTFNSLIHQINQNELTLGSTDFIPIVSAEISTLKFIAKKIGINKGNVQGYIIAILAIMSFSSLLIAILYLRKMKKL